ncbi:MAG TPA: NAD-dependent epimerase/dehydratase family protein [Fimbriimonadaceae bacterium]|nr:NAD-dependent epimerase/dehydratase family protein [Fimbriimonadaceae bacterium]
MRVLVTGCAGFIGHHLANDLLADGIEVVGVDNLDDYYSVDLKRQNLAVLGGRPGFHFIYGDLLDPGIQQQIFTQKPSIVVHLAGRAGVRPSVAHPEVYVRNNVAVTTELLQLAAHRDVEHFVFASSSSVYGNQKKVPFSETDPVDQPISPYAATKRACETISYAFHHLHGLPVSAVRFFTVYGPRQRPEMAFSLFANAMLRGAPVTLYGDGSTSRDYTYFQDIVDGVRLIMAKPTGHSIVNLGNSSPVTLREAVDLLARIVGVEPQVEHVPIPPGDVERTFADLDRAASVYGYRPKVSLEEGLSRFVAYLRTSR